MTEETYHAHMLSCILLFATTWTVACQAPLFMGFSRQEYWSGFPFPSPGDLLYPGIKLVSPVLGGSFITTEPPGRNYILIYGKSKYMLGMT